MNSLEYTVQEGEEIKLVIGPFLNPMEAGSDSFKVTTYADPDLQYIIDFVPGGMVPGIECNLPCLGCKGELEKDACTSCYQDATTNFSYLLENSCVSSCPELGYF
jgi:hypothetical protein